MFFDTNILIDWLLNRGNARAELKLHSRRRISRIVWAELLSGEPPDRRPPLLNYLDRFEVVEVDEPIVSIAVDFRQRTKVKLLDSLIYATAQHHGALLVTRNTKDYPPGTPGIHLPYTLHD